MKCYKVEKTASRGYAVGPAYVAVKPEIIIDRAEIDPSGADEEIKRYETAVEAAKKDLSELAEQSEIFAGHLQLVQDIALYNGVTEKIRNNRQNAESALQDTADEYVMIFESMDDEYMRERSADMKDVASRLMYLLKGISDNPFAGMMRESIIVAKDLTPSDTAKMQMGLVQGFITEEGGVTSHVSIIAKNLKVPCLVGVGKILDQVNTGDMLAMDAREGEIFLHPDEEVRKRYQRLQNEFESEEQKYAEQSSLPSVTTDGKTFELCANVGNIEDIKNAVTYQIDGIGLFRSEFLYMESSHFPTEDEQYQVYREAAELLEGKEVTIRTLDIGGDKGLDYFEFPKEENPFLGYRAIRMCLDKREIFKTQLRALLRASAFGHIRIMYPMIISVEELEAANQVLTECKEELKREGTAFDEQVETGVMIETPAAVLIAEELAAHADFFSIGTNDLTQYVLAVDRGNQKVSALYSSFHPAVLRAIAQTIEAGHRHGIKVGMCGEFASDEAAAGLLLGMGLDEFSMSASETARMKFRLRNTSFAEAQTKVQGILKIESLHEIMEEI